MIKSLVVPARVIADVGCDHGYIAEYCAKSGLCERVIASDISEKCLQKAKDLLASSTNVEFRRCDGIGYECDEAVISGMGGRLIAKILRSAVKLPKTLIVVPHSDIRAVRQTLIELGYGIDRDIPTEDRNKFYAVIRAVIGAGKQTLDELELLFGIECAAPSRALQSRLIKLYSDYSHARERNAERLKYVVWAMRLQGVEIAQPDTYI